MDSISRRPPPQSALPYAAAVAGVVMLAGAAAWFYWPQPEAPVPVPVPAPAPPAKPAEAPAHYPVPAAVEPAVAPKPLPALEASDAALAAAVAGLIGRDGFGALLRPESLVRRIVATVDNLPRRSYAQRLSPAQPVGGILVTTGQDESLALAAQNAARYAPWVRLVQSLEAKRVAAVYFHYYPLFQQAYVELGYPQGYFNNRLVQVIDHLLEAPRPPEPLRLTVRHVLPEFADPALEAESAGRKVLLRMGAANAAVVKAKLAEIRKEVTAGAPAAR